MQLGATLDEARKEWSIVPPLGASTALGEAKPGASVLAITNGPGGRSRPLVAVQRYGHGRTMVFAGEASWRWRMMLPSNNRTYETFWRQAGRWLAAGAPEPIALTLPSPAAGSTGRLDLDVRDAGVPRAARRHRVDAHGRFDRRAAAICSRSPIRPSPAVIPRASAPITAACSASKPKSAAARSVSAPCTTGCSSAAPIANYRSAPEHRGAPSSGERQRRRAAGGERTRSVAASSRAVRRASRRRAAARAAAVAHTVGVPADHRHPVGGMGPAPPMGVAMRRGVLRLLAACVIGMVVACPAYPPWHPRPNATWSIVSGAAGSAELAEQHAAWRTALVTALQDKMQMPPERLIVLIDNQRPPAHPARGAPRARTPGSLWRRGRRRPGGRAECRRRPGARAPPPPAPAAAGGRSGADRGDRQARDPRDARQRARHADEARAGHEARGRRADRVVRPLDVRWRGREVQPGRTRPRSDRVGAAGECAAGPRRVRQHDRRERAVHEAAGEQRARRDHRDRQSGAAVSDGVSGVLLAGVRGRRRSISTRTAASRFGKRSPTRARR